jgi:hypothetical protein
MQHVHYAANDSSTGLQLQRARIQYISIIVSSIRSVYSVAKYDSKQQA